MKMKHEVSDSHELRRELKRTRKKFTIKNARTDSSMPAPKFSSASTSAVTPTPVPASTSASTQASALTPAPAMVPTLASMADTSIGTDTSIGIVICTGIDCLSISYDQLLKEGARSQDSVG